MITSHPKYTPLVLDIQGFYKTRALTQSKILRRRLSRAIDHEVRKRKAAAKYRKYMGVS